MKKIAVGLCLALVTISCNKAKEVKLDTDEKKVSYAIGQEIGRGMKQQGLKVDVDALAMSIRDALADKESRMKPEEMQTAMINMRKKLMEEHQKKTVENEKVGKTFLDANKEKDGVKTTESGLQYQILTPGKGKKPKESDVVKVHYKGTLIDGKEFDSSYKRKEPAEFPVGRVIKGWIEALQMMKVGAKWKLFIPAELAYGSVGRPNIPPNSVLLFEVELLDIVKEKKNAAKKAKK